MNVGTASPTHDLGTGTLRAARTGAVLAALIGLPYAALNLYWSLGGHGLADEYGMHVLGRVIGTGRSTTGFDISSAILAVWMLATVVAGLRATGRPYRSGSTWTAWASAWGMAGYGLVMVLINTPAPLDAPVYRWHAYLFDPWYLVWGVALGAALLLAARARESHAADGLRRTATGPGLRSLQLGGQA